MARRPKGKDKKSDGGKDTAAKKSSAPSKDGGIADSTNGSKRRRTTSAPRKKSTGDAARMSTIAAGESASGATRKSARKSTSAPVNDDVDDDDDVTPPAKRKRKQSLRAVEAAEAEAEEASRKKKKKRDGDSSNDDDDDEEEKEEEQEEEDEEDEQLFSSSPQPSPAKTTATSKRDDRANDSGDDSDDEGLRTCVESGAKMLTLSKLESSSIDELRANPDNTYDIGSSLFNQLTRTLKSDLQPEAEGKLHSNVKKAVFLLNWEKVFHPSVLKNDASRVEGVSLWMELVMRHSAFCYEKMYEYYGENDNFDKELKREKKKRKKVEKELNEVKETLKKMKSSADVKYLTGVFEQMMKGISGIELARKYPFVSSQTGSTIRVENYAENGYSWYEEIPQRVLETVFELGLANNDVPDGSTVFCTLSDGKGGKSKEKKFKLDTDAGRQLLWSHFKFGVQFSQLVKDKRNDIAHDVRKAIDTIVFSLDGGSLPEAIDGQESLRAALGSPRGTFLFNLLRSCQEGCAAGKEAHEALVILLGAVQLSRAVKFVNTTTGTTSTDKIRPWHVDPHDITGDPFALYGLAEDGTDANVDDEGLVYGTLSRPLPFSAKAKYHLNGKTVRETIPINQVAFSQLIGCFHICANFGREVEGEYKARLGDEEGEKAFAPLRLTRDQVSTNDKAVPPVEGIEDQCTGMYKKIRNGYAETEIAIYEAYAKDEYQSRKALSKAAKNRGKSGASDKVVESEPMWSFPKMENAVVTVKGKVVEEEDAANDEQEGAPAAVERNQPNRARSSNAMPLRDSDYDSDTDDDGDDDDT